MTKMPPPPKKRYRVTYEIDCHDEHHLRQILNNLAAGTVVGGMPPPVRISSSGYRSTCLENDEWVPEDEYNDALDAWAAINRD